MKVPKCNAKTRRTKMEERREDSHPLCNSLLPPPADRLSRHLMMRSARIEETGNQNKVLDVAVSECPSVISIKPKPPINEED